MDLTLDGTTPVTGATITLPRVGRWAAVLSVDTADELTGAHTLASADGTLSMRGTVRRGGTFAERGRVELVGGANGLGAELVPRYYANAPASQVAGDLLRDAGETLSTTADASLLGVVLQAWVRARAPGYVAWQDLVDALGASWRVLFDGSFWLGREAWPELDLDLELLDDDPSDGVLVAAADTVPATLMPGVVWRGQRVSEVRHSVDGGRVRSTVAVERETDRGDRTSGPFDGQVRRVMAFVDRHALYLADVVAQAGDGSTVDLLPQPDLPAEQRYLPPMTGVPVQKFVPNATIKVVPGARVLLTFESGDPRRPRALLWQSGALDELSIIAATRQTLQAPEIKLGSGATRAVGLNGDNVTVSSAMTTWMNAVTLATGVPALVGTTIGTLAASATKARGE